MGQSHCLSHKVYVESPKRRTVWTVSIHRWLKWRETMTHVKYFVACVTGWKLILFQLAVGISIASVLVPPCFLRNTGTLKTSIPPENGTLNFQVLVFLFLSKPDISYNSLCNTCIYQSMSGWASPVSLGEVAFMLEMTACSPIINPIMNQRFSNLISFQSVQQTMCLVEDAIFLFQHLTR